jgi:hypothetical protein
MKIVLNQPWNFAAVTGAVGALVISFLITGIHRHPTPPSGASALQKLNILEQVPVVDAKPPASSASKSRTTLPRVRARENEVDYISGDVTVRYFTPGSIPQRHLAGYRQVDIGKDVTVRYFAPSAVVAPATPRPAKVGRRKTRL